MGTAAVLLGIEEDAATAQIVGVFVEAEHRGQGIGRRLVEALWRDSGGTRSWVAFCYM